MFQKNRAIEARTVIPEDVYYSLYQIIDQLWEDEKENYEGRSPEDKDGHLFEALTCIGEWLNSVRHNKVNLI